MVGEYNRTMADRDVFKPQTRGRVFSPGNWQSPTRVLPPIGGAGGTQPDASNRSPVVQSPTKTPQTVPPVTNPFSPSATTASYASKGTNLDYGTFVGGGPGEGYLGYYVGNNPQGFPMYSPEAPAGVTPVDINALQLQAATEASGGQIIGGNPNYPEVLRGHLNSYELAALTGVGDPGAIIVGPGGILTSRQNIGMSMDEPVPKTPEEWAAWQASHTPTPTDTRNPDIYGDAYGYGT